VRATCFVLPTIGAGKLTATDDADGAGACTATTAGKVVGELSLLR
jgi:hypothetical protein